MPTGSLTWDAELHNISARSVRNVLENNNNLCEWGLWEVAGGPSAAPSPTPRRARGGGWSGIERRAGEPRTWRPKQAARDVLEPFGPMPHKMYYGNTPPKSLILLGVRLAFRMICTITSTHRACFVDWLCRLSYLAGCNLARLSRRVGMAGQSVHTAQGGRSVHVTRINARRWHDRLLGVAHTLKALSAPTVQHVTSSPKPDTTQWTKWLCSQRPHSSQQDTLGIPWRPEPAKGSATERLNGPV